jgi:hypothetical protein
MDPESSSFSTADYSFPPDPPYNNDGNNNNNTPNNNDTFDTSTLGDTEYDSTLSGQTVSEYYFPLYFHTDCVIDIEFEEGVSPPCTTLPSVFVCGQSLPSLDSIRSYDLRDTVLYPVPVNPTEKIAYKESQIFNCNELDLLYRFPLYRTFKFNNPYKLYSYWNPAARIDSSITGGWPRIIERQYQIDCPSLVYRKKLFESYPVRNIFYTPPELSKVSNCYSVKPVRKNSLFVNQVIKRVCFSDITVYHSPPYDYTSDNKDPSKRLVVRSKSAFAIVNRRQSKCYRFFVTYEGRVPAKVPKWIRFNPWNDNKNLQGNNTLIHRDGRDCNKYLVPDPPITWFFKSDTETPKLFRFLSPKPVVLPDPIHPFSVNTDYPAIYKVFIKKGVTKIGDYSTDDKYWTRKHPYTLTEEDRQDRRQWIYRELFTNWIQKE